MSEVIGGSVIAILIGLFLIFVPIAVIWGWNVLFGSFIVIPYSLKTWAAVICLKGAFVSTNIKK
jgi:hypothetical protein